MRTSLAGKPGAPQRVSVSFEQGPSSSLKVTTSIPGGRRSTATILGPGSMHLMTPGYDCLLPPQQTPCPATAVRKSAQGYTVTFSSSPASRADPAHRFGWCRLTGLSRTAERVLRSTAEIPIQIPESGPGQQQ